METARGIPTPISRSTQVLIADDPLWRAGTAVVIRQAPLDTGPARAVPHRRGGGLQFEADGLDPLGLRHIQGDGDRLARRIYANRNYAVVAIGRIHVHPNPDLSQV